ncbi:acetyltransferase [Evansella sp. AB-rgal1]|uniref:acetyltransferase n=1 Tax=Evansella sp. AB-rgal1 TaxID=3242696 RepID=UPI00359EDC77
MIIKMTQSNMDDFNKSNEGFSVFGRIIPNYENHVWTYREEVFSKPYFKKYDVAIMVQSL